MKSKRVGQPSEKDKYDLILQITRTCAVKKFEDNDNYIFI